MYEILFELGHVLSRLMEIAFGFVTQNHFPLPLPKKEEAYHLDRVRDGDMNSRNILVEHNLRLVAHIVKKFDPNPQDTEDLISIGSIGLLKAINTFKKEKGARLATYASKCIENEILMHLRATKNDKNQFYLFDPLNQEEDDADVSFMDIIRDREPDIAEIVIQKIRSENVISHFSVLSDKERQVLELRYGLGGKPQLTQREIAKKMEISRSYVSRIEKKAVSRLSEMCECSPI